MDRNARVSALLSSIQVEMQSQQLWAAQSPSAEALGSEQTFWVDTLVFTEWVQWLMLPRLQMMIEQDASLPQNSNMHAMAEEAFKRIDADTKQLLELIEALDDALNVRH